MVTNRGICWSTTENPTITSNKTIDGIGKGVFASKIQGLMANTLYFIRAYATNSKGTAYGNQVSFTTAEPTSGTLTDIDGNVYATVKIGTQIWMAENLRVSRYRNGDSIPEMVNGFNWAATTEGVYCHYDNDSSISRVFGKLYNFFAVKDPRNLAPVGWHIPTKEEWQNLVDATGGRQLSGGNLKETGNVHWNLPNHGATNTFGFRALAAGNRNDVGNYINLKSNAFWWTNTEITGAGTFGVHYSMYTNTAYCESANADRHMGFTVRCVKDQ